MKIDHNFIEHQLRTQPEALRPAADSRGKVALLAAALLAAALAVATAPEPQPTTVAVYRSA